MADSLEAEIASGFSVPGTVCAQKISVYGVPKYLRNVPEDDVPVWLQRSEPITSGFRLWTPLKEWVVRFIAQLFRRLAGIWTYWGWKYGYLQARWMPARTSMRCYPIASQRSAPTSPQWFNTGLHWAYGIEGPAQGHSYVDPDTGELGRSTNAMNNLASCLFHSVSI